MPMKFSNDTIGKPTRDLPDVSQCLGQLLVSTLQTAWYVVGNTSPTAAGNIVDETRVTLCHRCSPERYGYSQTARTTHCWLADFMHVAEVSPDCCSVTQATAP